MIEAGVAGVVVVRPVGSRGHHRATSVEGGVHVEEPACLSTRRIEALNGAVAQSLHVLLRAGVCQHGALHNQECYIP